VHNFTITDSHYVKSVRNNLIFPQHWCVCDNTKKGWYRICRNTYDLFLYKISHAWLHWFITFTIIQKAKYRFHSATMFCTSPSKNFTEVSDIIKVYWLSNSMEQSLSCEANSHSASQEIPHLSLNLKVHYYVHKGLPTVPVMSHMIQVYILPPYFLKICTNISFPSMPRSSECSLPIRLRECYVPSHPILLDFITLTVFGETHNLWDSSLCSRLQFLPLPPSVQTQSTVSCSHTPSMHVIPLVWEAKFHTDTE